MTIDKALEASGGNDLPSIGERDDSANAAAAAATAPGEDDDLPPWNDPAPRPLSRAAHVGIFGKIVDALAPQTEADPVAILLQLLAMFGSVIGRTAHFVAEADTHFLNLFEVLVGQTAKSRKGVSAGQARRFFKDVDPKWTRERNATGLSTGEGLILSDPRSDQQAGTHPLCGRPDHLPDGDRGPRRL